MGTRRRPFRRAVARRSPAARCRGGAETGSRRGRARNPACVVRCPAAVRNGTVARTRPAPLLAVIQGAPQASPPSSHGM